MKKTILLVVCALLGVLSTSAQQMVLKYTDQDGVQQVLQMEVWRIDQMQFVPGNSVTLTDTPNIIDFGLGVRWADRNLGAASAKDPGLLIGWGDTTLTNYSTKLQYFPTTTAPAQISASQYDVAKVKWDESWHMPTEAELQELIDACNWEWVNDVENDSVGVVGKLKTDEAKTIFFPAAGYRQGKTEADKTAKGYYWTGMLGQATDKAKARMMSFSEGTPTPTVAEDFRYLGLAIRPVTGPVVVPTGLGTVTASSIEAQSATVTATLTGDLEDAPQVTIKYGTSADNLAYTKTVDEAASTITINLTGLLQNTTYYVKVILQTDNGTFDQTISFDTKKQDKFPVAEAVNLGLSSGTKWASWNMGSTSAMHVPETQYARYGWGDPTGEVHSLYASDYLISQNTSFKNGNIIDIAGTQYDIATVQWGTGWRLPRQSDFEELIRECTAERGTFTDANGVSHYGIKFIGPNGRSILLPAAGLRNSKGNLVSDNSLCAYWASTNLNNVSVPIPIVYSTSLSVDSKGPIYYQLAIRPVYEETSGSSSGSGGGESGGESGGEPGGESGGDSGQTQPETPSAGNAVDLGLSIYWADRNVGSSSASNVGYYIPWGDTQSRSDYSQSTYIHYKNNAYVVTGLQPLPAQYDAASQVWGGDWRMPTMEEWSDLINYCDWVEEGDGFRVYKKGSTKKSESIYLPTSGYKITDKGSVTTMSLSYCTYWTSTLSTTVQYKGAKGMAFLGRPSSDYKTVTVYDRYQGMPIRPVKNK